MILWAAQWNQDGSAFAVGGEHTLWIYDTDTLGRDSLLEGHDARPATEDIPYASVTHIEWHPSRDLIAVSSQGVGINAIYEPSTGGRIILPPLEDNSGRGVAWSPSGDRLAVSSPGDGHLRIYDAAGTLLHDVPRFGDARGLTGVAWSPTGDRIVTIGSRITLHDERGTPLRQILHRPGAEDGRHLLLSAAWHPSGDFFVVGDYGTDNDDPVLQFWTRDGEPIRSTTLEGDRELRNIAWAPDGTRFATSSSRLAIWSEAGDLLASTGAPDLLWGVSWHPHSDTILTSDIVGRITLWSDQAEFVEHIRVPDARREDPR